MRDVTSDNSHLNDAVTVREYNDASRKKGTAKEGIIIDYQEKRDLALFYKFGRVKGLIALDAATTANNHRRSSKANRFDLLVLDENGIRHCTEKHNSRIMEKKPISFFF